MSITITLSEETEMRLQADAAARGTEPAALLADLIEDLYGQGDDTINPQAVEEIRQALLEAESGEARGDHSLSVDDAFEELERRRKAKKTQQPAKNAA